ncbi:hypothetical protein [Streptomyces umbrinus]|uniref:hypothetical protein n=1 Tax=Streptomyces umbrinus TaxID=67370 RepID=UPI0033E1374F
MGNLERGRKKRESPIKATEALITPGELDGIGGENKKPRRWEPFLTHEDEKQKIKEAREAFGAYWKDFHTGRWKERSAEEQRIGVIQTQEGGELPRAERVSVADRIQAVRELRALQLEAERERWDLVDYDQLRERAYGVVDIIDGVVKDDALWRSMQEAAAHGDRLGGELLLRVEPIAWLALPALLEVAGYRSPPPVEELVQDTIEAVKEGSQPSAGSVTPPERLKDARAKLRRFVARTREDLGSGAVDRQSRAARIVRTVGSIVWVAGKMLVPAVIEDSGVDFAQQLADRGGFWAKLAASALQHASSSAFLATIFTSIGRDADHDTNITNHSAAKPRDWSSVHSTSLQVQLQEAEKAGHVVARADRLPPEEEDQVRQTAWSDFRWGVQHAKLRLDRLEQVLADLERFTRPVRQDIADLRAEFERIAPLLDSDTPPDHWPTGPADSTRGDLDVGQLQATAARLHERLRSR